jgi:hypothetical protein
LATAGDYVQLAFEMGQLNHSVENFVRVVRGSGRGDLDPHRVQTTEDLERLIGLAGSISSVNDLERLFRLE